MFHGEAQRSSEQVGVPGSAHITVSNICEVINDRLMMHGASKGEWVSKEKQKILRNK